MHDDDEIQDNEKRLHEIQESEERIKRLIQRIQEEESQLQSGEQGNERRPAVAARVAADLDARGLLHAAAYVREEHGLREGASTNDGQRLDRVSIAGRPEVGPDRTSSPRDSSIQELEKRCKSLLQSTQKSGERTDQVPDPADPG